MTSFIAQEFIEVYKKFAKMEEQNKAAAKVA